MIPTDTQTRTVTIQHGPSGTGMTGDLRPDDALPAPVRALIEELAVAEKWPTPEGWCARCGLHVCYGRLSDSPLTCDYVAKPWPFDRWLRSATGRAMVAVLGEDYADNPLREELWTAVGRRLVNPRSA